MPDITSPHNPRLKSAIQLRDRADRREQGRFLIDGVREIQRALESNIELCEIFVSDDPATESLTSHVLALSHYKRIPILSTARQPFEKLAFGERQSGIVAVAKIWNTALPEITLPTNPLVVIVEGVEKPGNLGAILRTADAAGISAVIATGPSTDWFNPNCVRASLGAIFSVPIATAEVTETLAWLAHQQLHVFAARVDAAAEYTTVSYREPCAIVLGSEAEGLTAAWSDPNITGITLPMLGKVDSLNVSVTAAILCYEAQRQRRDV
jgi:TrmH family RNA methyltransferase